MRALSIWTIYDSPSDMPGRFVARRHEVGLGPTAEHHVAGDLAGIRALLPHGLTCLGREPADDPVIVESWI